MQYPLSNRKVRGYTALVLAILTFVAFVYQLNYELSEIEALREWVGGTKPNLWLNYTSIAAGVFGIFALFFKIEAGRHQYVPLFLLVAVIFCLWLFQGFWWNWVVALALMLGLLLIGRLYPARTFGGGGQT
jgi:hypothetical protein